MEKSLIEYRHTGYSQSGEEGIIKHIVFILGINKGLCCEFGAWDGIHLSNTRALLETGWRGLLIEGDKDRFKDLLKTYPPGSEGICALEFVDGSTNSLAKIAYRYGITDRFDFVSIDIDGLDFEIFSSLKEFTTPPLVVCVEAHTCHIADDETPVPPRPSGSDPGQPLGRYVAVGRQMGYRLVGFLGTNAFFVHANAGHEKELPTISPVEAAKLNFALIMENNFAREYLFRVNLGLEPPYHKFGNPLFSRKSLKLSLIRALQLQYLNHAAGK
ncbi:hypothetical protein [Solidesulfovibrio sp.]|uniref:hypothetical protein n=1 Tax=Solidesulfovibrio sp. TaxID=2910990 RepID=UPI00262D4701|nr:hypothetical protein [Solidesulfovibrio sp.]